MFDEATGEKHIADIRTAGGLVVELQHSPITLGEFRSREAFYEHMVWIVDGMPFATRFEVQPDPLPHPESSLLDDVVFFPNLASAFWRQSEQVEGSRLVEMHHSSKIADRIQADYCGHHFFRWTRPHEVWFEASAPVYFDFGTDELLRLSRLGQQWAVQRIARAEVIEALLGSLTAPPSAAVPSPLAPPVTPSENLHPYDKRKPPPRT